MPSPHAFARRSTALLTGAALATSLTACATYTPLDRDAVRRVPEARIDLTERGTLELGSRVGAAVVSVDGRVKSVTDSSIVVALVQTTNRSGDTQQWMGESLEIPLGYVNGYRQRQPARQRTALLAGGITLGVLAIGAVFGAGSSSGAGNNGGGGVAK